MDVYVVNPDGYYVETYSSRTLFDANPDLIITKAWTNRLFKPRFDLRIGEWIEGLSTVEVEAREIEIQEQKYKVDEVEQLKKDNEMNAIAIMELTQIVMGGK